MKSGLAPIDIFVETLTFNSHSIGIMMNRSFWFLIGLSLIISAQSDASVLRPLTDRPVTAPRVILPKSAAEFPQLVPLQSTTDALAAPLQKRLMLLISQGPEGYKNLKRIADSQQMTQELRWRAVMAMAHIGGDESLPELKSYVGHTTWFMRSAALRALGQVNEKEALIAARKLFSQDPSLLVRSSAVQVIRELKDRESRSLLWKQLYADQNFHRGRSLWIRKHILEALNELSDGTQTQPWVRVLKEDEETLQKIALSSLERWKPLPSKSQKLDFEGKRAAYLSQSQVQRTPANTQEEPQKN